MQNNKIFTFKFYIMKNTKLFLIVAILASMLWSCKDSARDLTNAIPADAILVMQLDTKALLQKADYKPLDNPMLKAMFEEAKASAGDAKMKTLLEDFLKNPNKASGIGLLGDWFIYLDANTVGVLMRMNNVKKFQKMLTEQMEIPAEMLMEENGVTYFDTGDGVVGWTKTKLLFLTNNPNQVYNYRNPIDLTGTLVSQLTQNEGINANRGFAKFLKDKKDISLFYPYDNIAGLVANNPAYEELGIGEMITSLYEKIGEQFKGVSAGFFISFEKGSIEASNDFYYATSEAEKKLTAMTQQTTLELKGEQLKLFAEKPIFLMSFGIKGAGMYDYLADLGLIEMIEDMGGEELEQMGIDLKSLISNIEGDLTFAVDYSAEMPEITLIADLNDAQAMLDLIIKQVGDMLSIEKVSDNNSYVVSLDGLEAYLGVKNNTLYMTNSAAVYANVNNENKAKNDFAKMARGKTSLAFGNLSPLRELVFAFVPLDREGSALINEGFGLLGDYHYVTKKDMSGEGKIVINNKRNSLAAIVSYIESVALYAMQNF